MQSIRCIISSSLQPSWLGDCKVGFTQIDKRREMEGVSPENGFWSSFSIAHLTVQNAALFLEIWRKASSHHCLCAVVGAKRKPCVVLSLALERPSSVMRSGHITCSSVLNSVSPWPLSFHFCPTFAFFFHPSRCCKSFAGFKMSGTTVYCLFQFGKYGNVFYWLRYCFDFIWSGEEFFMPVEKSQVIIVIFKGPGTRLLW